MMTRIRLLTAFQVLSMPEGSYPGATHDTAHRTISEITGKFVIGTPPTSIALEGYLRWLDEHHHTQR